VLVQRGVHVTGVSIVLRYVSPNGKVCERFVRFNNASDDRTAAGLTEHLFGYMDEFKCGNKLLAQTYDGCVVMASAAARRSLSPEGGCPSRVGRLLPNRSSLRVLLSAKVCLLPALPSLLVNVRDFLG
jgi:hypothetical protein